MSRHYLFFNFLATLKKYSRKEFETEIFYYSPRIVYDRGPSVATLTQIAARCGGISLLRKI